jgi:hypothetical protein
MHDLILDLSNQANFLQVYDVLREVEPAGNGYSTPIPAFEIPFLFSRPVLAVKAFSQSARSYWKYGGTLTQRVQLGSGGTNSLLPIAENNRRSLRLGRTELCYFPMISSQYELLLECPHWLDDVRVTIWEYVGPITTEQMQMWELLRIDVLRVEAKVNAIAQQ